MSDMANMVRRGHKPNPGAMCGACHGEGRWYTECCNGAYGCSCGGDIVPMGRCNVCRGTGVEPEDSDPAANLAAIEGRPYIGSGPVR